MLSDENLRLPMVAMAATPAAMATKLAGNGIFAPLEVVLVMGC